MWKICLLLLYNLIIIKYNLNLFSVKIIYLINIFNVKSIEL